MLMKRVRTALFAGLGSVMLVTPAIAQEVGLQLYSLRHQMEESLPSAFQQIREWGISSVEGGGNLYGQSVNGFKALLDEYGLDIVSVDSHYEELRDNPLALVYKAQAYGSRFATFYWTPHDNSKPFTLENAKKAVEVMNTAGKLLRQNGITLQYHPHGYELIPYKDGTLLDYILENVTEAHFQMDVFWIKQAGGDPAAMLKKYPGKFTSLHLKDRKVGTPGSSNGRADIEASVALGTGDVDIGAVMEEAKIQDIRYAFIEDESSAVLQQIPLSLKFLNELRK